MEIKPYGDDALLVNFDQTIDPEVNRSVLQLDRLMHSQSTQKVRYTIPAYCSLVVVFDPRHTSFRDLRNLIRNQASLSANTPEVAHRRLLIPVCYHPDYGLDLINLSEQLQIDPDLLIQQHCDQVYQVYMLGFLPGFVYMGKLPSRLFCARKQKPRKVVPAQSVGLAGAQTGIYPQEAPGGWQIIGKTPVPTFTPQQREPFLFQAGDLVKFKPITQEQFLEVEAQIANRQFQLETFNV